MSKIILLILSLAVVLGLGCGSNNTDATTKPIIPDNCVSWFDGCNSCSKTGEQMTTCTERICAPEDYKKAKCLKYKK